MGLYEFYRGEQFDAQNYLGAHPYKDGYIFRVYAPHAEKVSLIGEFNGWEDSPMQPILDGKIYAHYVPEAAAGMMYKFRIYEEDRFLDRSDPYGFQTEKPPQTASVIYDRRKYQFGDQAWMQSRTDCRNEALNIYELHVGSWREGCSDYRSLAEPLAEYVKEMGFNYVEFMPLCEYPADASWGYQATGFFAPTARWGSPDDLKYLVDRLHQQGIGVILDFPITHFAVDDFGLGNFDGKPLYEYPHPTVGYNEWGSKNFNYGKGEVRTFLQSSLAYWLAEFHFDGIRMDAVSNLLYWQGDNTRGQNTAAVEFLKTMNRALKALFPEVMLIAEDSSAFANVTLPVEKGGLGFDYKWDMGWMNDTLNYFRANTATRIHDYHRLTFSMHYFYNEDFLLPLSHDEVVHGKATIIQKMNGDYEEKFPQARALYMYMYAHPGKKLNFMGNEFAQFREWDEKREQDWLLMDYPYHDSFRAYFKALNHLYLNEPALYAEDFSREGFRWIDCEEGNTLYSFVRRGKGRHLLAVFNFGQHAYDDYDLDLEGYESAELLLDSNWRQFSGHVEQKPELIPVRRGILSLRAEAFSGRIFRLKPTAEGIPDKPSPKPLKKPRVRWDK